MKSLCQWGIALGWLLAISGRVWADSPTKTVTLELNMECQDPGLCSLDLVRRLEATYGCQFEAKTPADTVCGAVSIVHCDLANPTFAQDPVCAAVASHGMNHVVTITLYEADEGPTPRRKTTLKHLMTLPTETEVMTEARKTPKAWGRVQPLLTERAALKAAGEARQKALKMKLGLSDADIADLKTLVQ